MKKKENYEKIEIQLKEVPANAMIYYQKECWKLVSGYKDGDFIRLWRISQLNGIETRELLGSTIVKILKSDK